MTAHTTEAQAKIVRDALRLTAAQTMSPRVMTAAMQLSVADDETLAKFGRMVR